MTINEQTARKNLDGLIKKYAALSADERKIMSEASVVRQFIDILLRDVLGWPIEDPNRYRYEQVTQAGRPDMMLTPEAGGTIFVEAKRFGLIKELEESRKTIRGIVTPGQLSLPGMAVDRTPEEQQAINYAFQNNGTWAILTNFEKLRLFNARRDWLVLSFETPSAFLSEFDLLWQLAYPNVVTGSLDRLSNQRLTAEIDSEYLKFINEWREKLAQDLLQHRAQNPWAFTAEGQVDLVTVRSVVQRILDRLVIIRFAEDHLVVPPGTLRALNEAHQQSYLMDVGEMLKGMFRRFNEIHNSALFAPGLADKAIYSDKTLIGLVSKLYEARYRSMPADIMGNTYEQYLGKTLVRRNGAISTADNLETRKKQGSYYTPQVIVRYMVDQSLGRYLYGTDNGQAEGRAIPGERRKTSAEIQDLRVLDSACGSGSFLIYAYEVLNGFYEGEKARLEGEREQRREQLVKEGMVDPFTLMLHLTPYTSELERIHNPARLILETHLYGVDLDPQAAEIAVVNLMMRGMERRHQEKRLPLILNQNVKVGNGLVGLRYDDPRMGAYEAQIKVIRRLRTDLIRVPHDSPEHEQIIHDLDQAVVSLNSSLNKEMEAHFSDVPAVHPFHWGVEFPEVFFDEEGKALHNPGFTIIVGNPPWEILKPDLREFYAQFDPEIESKLNRQQVEKRIEALDKVDPRRREQFNQGVKVVEATSAYVRGSGDYQRQGRGDVATHKLFLERMYGLLRGEGRLGYVVPSGIYTDLGTKALREMLLNEGNVQYLYSFSNERFFFKGVDHRFKFAMLGAQKGAQAEGFWSVFRFNPRVAVAPEDLPGFVGTRENLIYMRRESLARFSPESLSVMEFQTRRDYEVVEKVYGDLPLLGETVPGGWAIRLNRQFDMANDRALLNTLGQGVPLYEGKMIHQYDAFYDKPQFWISNESVAKLTEGVQKEIRSYRVVHRRIARSTDERTLISAIVPCNSACDTNATMVLIDDNSDERIKLYVCALFNSFVLDHIIRYKVSTTLNMFYLQQLPLPRLTPGNRHFEALVPRAARLTCTRAAFGDLWQAVMGEGWDESKGTVDPGERQRLRDEIDAIVAHLYGLSREDFEHILGTFPLVFPDNEGGRVKRAALVKAYEGWG